MNIKQLKTFCEETPLIVHNAQFENRWLLDRGINPNIVDDTLLLAYLYDERLPLDLESLCLRFDIDSVFKEHYGEQVANIEGEDLINRNVRDARNTKCLRDVLWSMLSDKEKNVYTKVLLPATKTLAKIENRGVCYSPEKLQALIGKLDKAVFDLDLENDEIIKAFEGCSEKEFNIDSWKHRLVVVYDLLEYKPLKYKQAKTGSGEVSTNSKVLKKLLERRETETLRKIIEYSSYQGWKEKYEKLEAECEKCGTPHTLEIDGKHYVFANLKMASTTTGRIASDHPNMQNLPSREGGWTREIFIPRNEGGILLDSDYDGIELRLLAGLSGDEKLIEDFRAGKDPHIEMAKTALGKGSVTDDERHLGKTLNYAIPFGAGIGRVAFETNQEFDVVKKWIKNFWKEHRTLRRYLDSIPESGIVKSPTGMERHCETWTEGKNFPIQNSALVALLVGLNKLVDEAKEIAPIDLCIHDSVRQDVVDIKYLDKAVGMTKELLEFKAEELFPWLPIPLTVSCKVGKDWGNMEDYNA